MGIEVMTPQPALMLIDIGGTQSTIALGTPEGSLETKRAVQRPPDQPASWIFHSLLERIETLQREFPEKMKCVQVCGIGFGGPISGGRPIRSEHVPGWDQIDICRELSGRWGWNCRIENDGLVGALGEFHYGAARGTRNAVYLTISTGIGGGVIIDSRLYRGSRGFAGHLGHIKIGLDGPQCACGGRGCFEALCSGSSIARRAVESALDRPGDAAALIRQAGGAHRITAKDLLEAAAVGDPFSHAMTQEIACDFGRALASIYHALDPDVVVLGGGVSRAGDSFFTAIALETESRVLPQFRGEVKIIPAALGADSVLFGAMALALGLD